MTAGWEEAVRFINPFFKVISGSYVCTDVQRRKIRGPNLASSAQLGLHHLYPL